MAGNCCTNPAFLFIVGRTPHAAKFVGSEPRKPKSSSSGSSGWVDVAASGVVEVAARRPEPAEECSNSSLSLRRLNFLAFPL